MEHCKKRFSFRAVAYASFVILANISLDILLLTLRWKYEERPLEKIISLKFQSIILLLDPKFH